MDGAGKASKYPQSVDFRSIEYRGPTYYHIAMKLQKHIFAYSVHLFTASGVVLSFFSLLSIINGRFIEAFYYNAAAVFVDSVDGFMARRANVKQYAVRIDGALMDNIIDFITYTLMPALFIMFTPFIGEPFKLATISGILLSSIFQFSNTQAKTKDHYFLGFPSYWNIVVLYLWIWNLPVFINVLIIWSLVILSFVPIKFIYPSRLDFFSKKIWLRNAFFSATVAWGIATFAMLMLYPNIPAWGHVAVIAYVVWYTALSLMKTFERSK